MPTSTRALFPHETNNKLLGTSNKHESDAMAEWGNCDETAITNINSRLNINYSKNNEDSNQNVQVKWCLWRQSIGNSAYSGVTIRKAFRFGEVFIGSPDNLVPPA